MWKPVFAILLGLLAGLWEVAATPFLPVWLVVYPVIAFGVFFVLVTDRSRWMLYALSAGLVIDLYSFSHGSLSTLRFVLVFLLVEQLAQRWLTNRSLLAALALVLAARLFDLLSGFFFGHAFVFLGSFPEAPLWPERTVAMLIWDVVQMSLWFGLGLLFTRRFFVSAGSRGLEPPYGPSVF